jgi:hypothetical protein
VSSSSVPRSTPEAFVVYRTARARLADELGVDPGPVLAAAQAALLRDTPLGQPVAAGPEVEPPARTGAEADVPANQATMATPRQLPADVYGFVGRRPELRRLDQLLTPERTADRAAGRHQGTRGPRSWWRLAAPPESVSRTRESGTLSSTPVRDRYLTELDQLVVGKSRAHDCA